MFGILERLGALPDLVLGEIFEQLPVVYATVLARSQDVYVRQAAGLRQWRRVHVGVKSEQIDCSNRYTLTYNEFNEMVDMNSAPPFPVHSLCYATNDGENDPLFMTPAWRAYISAHAKTITLCLCVSRAQAQCWESVVPHLGSIRLTDLRLCAPGGLNAARPLFDDVALPNTLHTLHVEVYSTAENELSGLVIPSSVRCLRLVTFNGIHPALLPALPPRLRSLSFNWTEGADMSEHMGLFPRSLLQLDMVVHRKYPLVRQAALEHCPCLRHNMVVYQNMAALNGFRGLWLVADNGAQLNLDELVDYSQIQLPQCVRLLRWLYGPERPLERLVPLSNIQHWFAQLDKLWLVRPRRFAEVQFPATLDVEVVYSGGVVAPETWVIPRLSLLLLMITGNEELGPLGSAQLLRQLILDIEESSAPVTIPAPPRLKKAVVRLWRNAVFPDLSRFASVTRLSLMCGTHTALFHTTHLPPNLRTLQLTGELLTSSFVLKRGGPLLQPMDFSHLRCLETLEIGSLYSLRLGSLKLPDCLVSLECLEIADLSLRGAVFPPRLQQLTMHKCGLTNPWSVSNWRLLRSLLSPVIYPDSLCSLRICHNGGLIPPHPGFVYPPHLRHVDVSGCMIEDLSPFRFPNSLLLLDVSGNRFPIPERFPWPPLSWLRVSSHENSSVLTPEEYKLLRRQIPGVRISS